MKKIVSLFVFLLASYSHAQPDAVFDSSFGANGVAQFSNVPAGARFAFAIQNDSKIVMVAAEFATAVVVRMNVDGTIDTGFGVNGKVIIADGTIFPDINVMAIALDRNQNIIVGWYSPVFKFQVFALDPSGARLPGFHQGDVVGMPQVEFGNLHPTIAIADTGSIYLGLQAAAGINALVAKLTSNGVLDQSFNAENTPGYVELPGTFLDAQVALTNDGRLRIASFSFGSQVLVFGLLPDGRPDGSFGVNGIAVAVFTGAPVNSFKILHDGRLVLGDIGGNLLCLTRDGFIDSSFGDSGRLILPGSSQNTISWFSVRSNGSIDCVLFEPGSQNNFLLRVSSSGHIENDFNFTPTPLFFDGSYQTAIDADGNFIVVGLSLTASFDFALTAVKFKMESLRYSQLSKALWRRYYNRV